MRFTALPFARAAEETEKPRGNARFAKGPDPMERAGDAWIARDQDSRIAPHAKALKGVDLKQEDVYERQSERTN